MPSFVVDTYKVRLMLQRSGNPPNTVRTRMIEIASTPQFHGIVEKANLAFSTTWDNWAGSPVVGYYSVSNPLQPILFGWLPSSEYSYWYDVLRAERPLTFFYDITPIGGAPYVSQISLGTSTEPIGEGPADFTP
jgi:hypothetical protein